MLRCIAYRIYKQGNPTTVFCNISVRKNRYDFLFNVLHFTPQVRLLFVQTMKGKIFGLKNMMEGRIRKVLIFVIHVKLNFKFS